ncbi:phosphatase PAP2 family protein [Limosilactobacillus reuteri]|uniref:Phosphatase PAP2 family protein n=1 Tax=Limosilactobacillus reuteri TaxID=1598 RepID=A0A1Y4P922_LIMRT|nr:phosphatase PAP2 family protein [Limosilactobacillus reuteri]MQB65280.1 PAP2 family protein [Limosilactobacillus reuteri]OUN48703.1 phosphatase PAP2 family protein [Limosilactobacillus reuteri]OUP88871.1 phosphatase PAP2 family protein [Limosilactobacillus reuteri]
MKKDYLQFYQHITAPFYRYPWTIPLLRAVNKFVVWTMYVAYIVILVWVGKNNVLKAGPFLLIPGIGFILLSFIRQRIDAPRPYEEFSINPLILRQKTGDSLPSRHVFSATIIAMCGLRLNLILGVILLVLAVVSAITRVIGGVHFPRDVVIGFICGFICGLFLFLV